jgi:hypothetical protein
MEKRNKLWRKRHQCRLFKARMILRAAYKDCIWDIDGNLIEHPHWFELAKQKWNHIYKTTGTPCSCCICKGERYNRRDFKKDTQRIIRESLE